MRGLNPVPESADSRSMPSRLTSLAPRLFVLTAVWVFATTSITLASDSGPATTPAAPSATPPSAVTTAEPQVELTVPDVRRQSYVFAKGILEDAGFAWRVAGKTKGYAVNRVAWQSPAPGTRVLDTGAPLVLLRLAKSEAYEQRGIPADRAPYKATGLVYAEGETPSAASATPVPEPVTPPAPAPPPPAASADDTESAAAPAKAATPKHTTSSAVQAALIVKPKPRTPDFVVPGAPSEPVGEMPLVDRARLLAGRMAAAPKTTPKLMRYFSYQHNWIVYGARFGWKDGDVALRILVGVDQDLERRFDTGQESEKVARAALAFVQSRKAR
jgi:hypothetical protein